MVMAKGFSDQHEKPANQLLRNKVTEDEIAEVVSKWTGIPVSKMLEGERDKLLRMEDELHRRVVGQEEAIVAVSDAIRRNIIEQIEGTTGLEVVEVNINVTDVHLPDDDSGSSEA